MAREESFIRLEDEREGFIMSEHRAWSGCEWVRWRRRLWRGSSCRFSRNENGGGARDGGGIGDLIGFILFFRVPRLRGAALTSVAIGFPFEAGPVSVSSGLTAFLRPSGGAMKFNARRTASLRSSGGGSSTYRAEPLGDAVGVKREELGWDPWARGMSLACLASNIL